MSQEDLIICSAIIFLVAIGIVCFAIYSIIDRVLMHRVDMKRMEQKELELQLEMAETTLKYNKKETKKSNKEEN